MKNQFKTLYSVAAVLLLMTGTVKAASSQLNLISPPPGAVVTSAPVVVYPYSSTAVTDEIAKQERINADFNRLSTRSEPDILAVGDEDGNSEAYKQYLEHTKTSSHSTKSGKSINLHEQSTADFGRVYSPLNHADLTEALGGYLTQLRNPDGKSAQLAEIRAVNTNTDNGSYFEIKFEKQEVALRIPAVIVLGLLKNKEAIYTPGALILMTDRAARAIKSFVQFGVVEPKKDLVIQDGVVSIKAI